MDLLPIDPLVRRRLPLGYARIFVSDEIPDEQTSKRLTLVLTKYRQSLTYIRHSDKPISKLEL